MAQPSPRSKENYNHIEEDLHKEWTEDSLLIVQKRIFPLLHEEPRGPAQLPCLKNRWIRDMPIVPAIIGPEIKKFPRNDIPIFITGLKLKLPPRSPSSPL